MEVIDCTNNFVCSISAPTVDNPRYRVYCERHKKCNIFKKIARKSKRIASHTQEYDKKHPELKTGKLNHVVIKSLIVASLKSGFKCPDCGEVMELNGRSVNHPKTCSLDHIIPRWIGGTHDVENLRIVCYQCNQKKGRDERPTYV